MHPTDSPAPERSRSEDGETGAAGRDAGGTGDPGGGATSGAAEDYLKAVYKLQPPTGGTVSTSALADELGRSAAAVTNMVKSLAEKGHVEHVPYHGVRLTRRGEQSALRILRRHRVIELYLIEKLGYRWDNVHEEAERMEHASSDELVDRMAAALGDPDFDPHGAPIPTAEGEMADREGVALSELDSGARVVVREVEDDDSERLRYLASMGLYPGTELTVESEEPLDGPITVQVGGESHVVDQKLARSIVVEEL